ncbi:MAG: isoprenyl transferase [Alphaproteobacteria bacterium]|nr:isoprenyl transferase [Alphaproteobacteria bacterium]
MPENQTTNQNLNSPAHVAIIMDGNGRWAQSRGLPRTAGHKQGAEAVRRIVRAAGERGVQYLTLFGFSSENWSRPESEITELMKLLRYYLRAETAELHKSNVRLRVIGERSAFDDDIVQLIENAEKLTENNNGITVIIALNYGGRADIAQAARQLLLKATSKGGVPAMKDMEKAISANLMTAGIPDPDLLIRTSGEKRISNFLLWQCAYTEMVFTPALWPDFDANHFDKALAEYAARDRRFGALSGSQC